MALALCMILFITGWLLQPFYYIFGNESYVIVIDANLQPERNSLGDIIDVKVLITSRLETRRVPHEVIGWQIYRETTSTKLFDDDYGSFSMSLDIKIENFSHQLFHRTRGVESPQNTRFTIYFKKADANENTMLQVSISAWKKVTLRSLHHPIEESWNYLEKLEV